MTDYTADIAQLESAYRANRVANASIATEVRAKYRTIIADEIRRRKQEVDLEFAHLLAVVKARNDMPLGVIQEHILHTKAWDRWVYWRDLAQIDPERVSVTAAREAKALAAKPYQWSEDFSTLTLTRTSTGVELENPIVFPAESIRIRNGQYSAVSENERYELAAVRAETHAKDYFKMLDGAIREQIEAGNVAGPEGD